MAKQTYLDAVSDTYYEILDDFDEALIVGEDVRKSLFDTTSGLVEEFGEERVIDTPISEAGFVGAAIGAAMEGKRPIVELQINTLPLIAMDQLLNHAAKLHYMSGGQQAVPLTVTVPMAGASGGNAGQHSDATQSLLMHYGMKTVIPSTPADAKGIFRSAVTEDDPVMMYHPAVLQGTRGEVPETPYEIPLGEADIKRPGEDVTVVAIGEMVPEALSAAERVADDISVEVIDPRTLLPLDEATIFKSLRKTGRVVVAENANRVCGVAAEIAARIANQSLWDLDAPVKRVTRDTAPVSYSPQEEQAILPDDDDVTRAVADVTGRD